MARLVALVVSLAAWLCIPTVIIWALFDKTQVMAQAVTIGLAVFAALIAWLVAAMLAPVKRPFSDEIDRW